MTTFNFFFFTYEVCTCIHAGHKHGHPWIHRVYICMLYVYVCVCECAFMPLFLHSAENNQLITLKGRSVWQPIHFCFHLLWLTLLSAFSCMAVRVVRMWPVVCPPAKKKNSSPHSWVAHHKITCKPLSDDWQVSHESSVYVCVWSKGGWCVLMSVISNSVACVLHVYVCVCVWEGVFAPCMQDCFIHS